MKNIAFPRIFTGLLFLSLTPLACACTLEWGTSGLVPPTVDQDPLLPRMEITVQGTSRRLHVRTAGDPDAPVLLVIHGSLSDMRAYQPFAAFADAWHVVWYDMSGNGLSSRLDRKDLSIDAMVEEIHQVKLRISPERPISVLGHSWSADFVALYLARYPGEVENAILMEPFGLRDVFMTQVEGMVNLTRHGYLDMYWMSSSLSPRDQESLDFRILGMLHSAVRNFFVDPDHLPPWPVWRVGGLALLVWESSLISPEGSYRYDFTPGLEDFDGRVLLVGSSHSPIGYRFQERNHQPLFARASSLRIENSGHRMITEQWDALESGIRAFLQDGGQS